MFSGRKVKEVDFYKYNLILGSKSFNYKIISNNKCYGDAILKKCKEKTKIEPRVFRICFTIFLCIFVFMVYAEIYPYIRNDESYFEYPRFIFLSSAVFFLIIAWVDFYKYKKKCTNS